MANNNISAVSLATYNRLPLYLKALYGLRAKGEKYASSVTIADTVRENPSVVKKDLSYAITSEGKPKVGYEIDCIIADIEEFLGYNNVKDAILVGVGKLGQALMGYAGFEKYGLNIIAGFDVKDEVIGSEVHGKKVLPTGKMQSLVEKLDIKIGILTTPAEVAQVMAETMVESGIRAIWNFSPTHLELPEEVIVKNEDMAASLAILSAKLKEKLVKED